MVIRIAVKVKDKRGVGSWSAHGRGRRSAISRSNNRNKIATKKNRIENGSRADPKGSNPHS